MMRKDIHRCAFAVVTLALLLMVLPPRPAQAANGSGVWRHLTALNSGLPQSHVQAVLYEGNGDGEGVPGLWIGTPQGLSFFNGREWAHFTAGNSGIVGNDVLALFLDEGGTLWVGTSEGLSRFGDGGTPRDSKDDEWVSFGSESGLPSTRVQTIAGHPQGIVVGTDAGAATLETEATAAAQFQQATWQQLEGVAGTDVRAIALAHDDTLWFATSSGVSHYDGTRWLTLHASHGGLPSDDVRDVAEEGEGFLWFATASGAARLSPDGTWTIFGAGAGLVGGQTTRLAVDSLGQVWVGTAGAGVSRFQPKLQRWERFFKRRHGLVSDNVLCIAAGPDTLWFGTDAGLSGYDGTWQTATVANSKASQQALGGNRVFALWGDEAGLVWAGSEGGGLSVYDPGADRWQSFTTADGLGDDRVHAVWGDGEGRIWAGLEGGDLSLLDHGGTPFDPNDDRWHLFTEPTGLTCNVLWGDEEGRIWIGGDAGGLSVFDHGGTPFDTGDDRWQTFTPANGLGGEFGDFVNALWDDGEGRIWAGTASSLSVLDHGGTPFDPRDDRWQTFTTADGLGNDRVLALGSDEGGRMWIGTHVGGLSVLDYGGTPLDKGDDRWQTFTTDDALGALTVQALWIDGQGHIWAGTNEGGISVLDHDSTPLDKGDDAWHTFTADDGLRDDSVLALWGDGRGHLWAGSDGGGLRFLDYGDTPLDPGDDLRQTFVTSDGQGDDSVSALWVDGGGRLWAGSDGGLSVLDDGGTADNPSDDVWHTFTTADGLADKYVQALWGDEDDRIWIATRRGGLSVFDTGRVLSAAYSPDGTRIVTASSDGTARIWDAENGRQLLTLAGHTDTVTSAAYSPDGARIVTASYDGTARIWDAKSGQHLLTLTGHTDIVTSAAYSPDGARIVTASADGTARIWDAESGQHLLTLTGHTGNWVISAAYSPGGTRIVTASADGTARIWDAESGQHLLTLTGHTHWVWSAAYRPDGTHIVTASADGTARIWDAESGQHLLTLSGHTNAVESAAYSPDGRHIVTGSDDRTARIWDAENGQELLTLAGHTAYVTSAAYSPDGTRIVIAAWDGTARVWDAQTGQETLRLGASPSWHTFRQADGLGSDYLEALWGDKEGRIWVGTFGGGLSILDHGGTPFDPDDDQWWTFTTADGLADNMVKALWGDEQGHVWIGTDRGLSLLQHGGTPFDPSDDTWLAFTQAGDQRIDFVQVLWIDEDDHVWVGTVNGLHVLDYKATPFDPADDTWHTFTSADGLGYDHVTALWGDEPWHIWIGTDGGGLTFFNHNGSPFDPSDDVWRTFTNADGLGSNLAQAVWGDGESRVWVSTFEGGVSCLYPSDHAPWARWNTVLAGDEALRAGEAARPLAEGDISIVFDGGDLMAPFEELRYAYWLEGPVTISGRTGVIGAGLGGTGFADLPSGQYTFKLEAEDRYGRYSEPVSLPIELYPLTLWGRVQQALPAVGLGVGLTVLVFLAVATFGVARRNQLPLPTALRLLLTPRQLAPMLAGGEEGYARYLEKVTAQGSPLEQLLTLVLPIREITDIPTAQEALAGHGAPASPPEVREALGELAQRGVLARVAPDREAYHFPEPAFPQAHRRSIDAPARIARLAKQVREQTPLYSDALRFFPAAGFQVQELSPSEFLIQPRNPIYRERFGDIYTRIVPDRALRREDVTQVHAAAGSHYEEEIAGRIAFVVVNRTPEAGARFEIYACRADADFTVIPLPHSLLRQALLDETCGLALDEQIRQARGEADLYAVSTPVTDVLSFFGRARLIDDLLHRMDLRQHVGLFGLRKMGKTSLIWQLKERLAGQPVAFVDLQAVAKDCRPLYGRIVHELARDIAFKHPELTLPPLALAMARPSAPAGMAPERAVYEEWSENQVVEAFAADLLALRETLASKLSEPRLLIFLDEVERLLPAPGHPGFAGYEGFLGALRGTAQRYGFLTLVVAGVDPLITRTDRWEGIDNPAFKLFQEVFLPPFEPDECAEMVTNIGQQMGLSYTPQALARLHEESGGHPFLTRELCSLAVRDLPRPGTVEEARIIAAVREYVLQPGSYLESLWEERLDADERALLEQLVEAPATLEELVPPQASPAEKRVWRRNLARLEENFLVARSDDRYRITWASLARWVRVQILGEEE